MKLKYYTFFLGLIFISSCSKDIEVNKPDFDVATNSTTYKVGEDVKFSFSGSANYVSFYSGEEGNDYTFKAGREIDIASEPVMMGFTSSLQSGTQTNQLSILISSDFNGNYGSIESLSSATWTDITSRFALGTTATFLASGVKDISDLIVPGKPIYIAFKYLTRPQATNGLVRTWMIQSFNMKSDVQFNDQNLIVTDQILAGFRIVDQDAENTPSRSLVTSTRVTLQGNIYKNPADPKYDAANPIYDPTNPIYDPASPSYVPGAVRPPFVAYDPASPYNDPTRENWAVSAPIYANKVNLGPDLSVPIKGIRNGLLKDFTHIYNKPGTYKVHFIASNTNVDGTKEVDRSITITVTN